MNILLLLMIDGLILFVFIISFSFIWQMLGLPEYLKEIQNELDNDHFVG